MKVSDVFDSLIKHIFKYNLTLYDTAGQEEYEALRPMFHGQANVFILCYSVDTESSFENIKNKWVHELRSFGPNTPIILAANKIDTRLVFSLAH